MIAKKRAGERLLEIDNVHVVDAGAGPGHDSKLRRSREKAGGHLRRASDQERVGVGKILGERCRGSPRTCIDLPGWVRAKQLECGSREVVGYNDLHRAGLTINGSWRARACERS